MSETFDNKLPKATGEFLDTPRRIMILADAIIDIEGKEDPDFPGEIFNAEWRDSETGTTIKLHCEYEEDDTRYFIEQFNTHNYKSGMKPIKTYYMEASANYQVHLLNAKGNLLPVSEYEHDCDPEAELLDIMINAPIDGANVLDRHEQAMVNDRFQHMIGRYVLERSHVLRNKLYGAFRRKDPEKQEEALINIAETMTLYGGLSVEHAYDSIQGFRLDHEAKRQEKKAA